MSHPTDIGASLDFQAGVNSEESPMTARTIPTLDEWFMDIAAVVATRSTCMRRCVGCVVVDTDNRIISTGYNGVPSGFTHCVDKPCGGQGFPSGEGLDFCMAVHAEQNAIARLSDVRAAHKIYCTTEPCIQCTKLIAATSIKHVIFRERYRSQGEELFKNLGRSWKWMPGKASTPESS